MGEREKENAIGNPVTEREMAEWRYEREIAIIEAIELIESAWAADGGPRPLTEEEARVWVALIENIDTCNSNITGGSGQIDAVSNALFLGMHRAFRNSYQGGQDILAAELNAQWNKPPHEPEE